MNNIASKSTELTFEALENMVKPGETRKYFIIYLESGSSIITESYWEEDNMIMYRKYGGSMGIEKAKVKKVVTRVHKIIKR